MTKFGRGWALILFCFCGALLIGSATMASPAGDGQASLQARRKSGQRRAAAKELDPTRYDQDCIHACQEQQRACMLICANVSDDADHKACVKQCIDKYVSCGKACPLKKQ